MRPVVLNVYNAAKFCASPTAPHNCESVVVRELGAAMSSINFLAFSFTSQPLSDILFLKNKTILVDGILDPRQTDSPVVPLATFYTGSGVLHHKVFIIDNSTVLFGSYNPTYRGNAVNDEVLLIVRDTDFAYSFLAEHFRLSKSASI